MKLYNAALIIVRRMLILNYLAKNDGFNPASYRYRIRLIHVYTARRKYRPTLAIGTRFVLHFFALDQKIRHSLNSSTLDVFLDKITKFTKFTKLVFI